VDELAAPAWPLLYLGRRAPMLFDKKVAIKVSWTASIPSAATNARFRQERHVLGQLDYSLISPKDHRRGVDWGNDVFRDGVRRWCPHDAYCRENKLSIPERFNSFLKFVKQSRPPTTARSSR